MPNKGAAIQTPAKAAANRNASKRKDEAKAVMLASMERAKKAEGAAKRCAVFGCHKRRAHGDIICPHHKAHGWTAAHVISQRSGSCANCGRCPRCGL